MRIQLQLLYILVTYSKKTNEQSTPRFPVGQSVIRAHSESSLSFLIKYSSPTKSHVIRGSPFFPVPLGLSSVTITFLAAVVSGVFE